VSYIVRRSHSGGDRFAVVEAVVRAALSAASRAGRRSTLTIPRPGHDPRLLHGHTLVCNPNADLAYRCVDPPVVRSLAPECAFRWRSWRAIAASRWPATVAADVAPANARLAAPGISPGIRRRALLGNRSARAASVRRRSCSRFAVVHRARCAPALVKSSHRRRRRLWCDGGIHRRPRRCLVMMRFVDIVYALRNVFISSSLATLGFPLLRAAAIAALFFAIGAGSALADHGSHRRGQTPGARTSRIHPTPPSRAARAPRRPVANIVPNCRHRDRLCHAHDRTLISCSRAS